MKVAIVGAEASKFTVRGEAEAREHIRLALRGVHSALIGRTTTLLDALRGRTTPATLLISGGCHLGGIDIWAEEEAIILGIERRIHKPRTRSWAAGYKPRNIKIATDCDVLFNITVNAYPDNYVGMSFAYCYHCDTDRHVKSGGCWTLRYAAGLGKQVYPITVIN